VRYAVISIIALAWNAAIAQETPIVRLTVSPESVAVGEAARMQVTVLVPTWFPEPPVFPSFELSNAVTQLPPDSSYPTSERAGRETWSGIVRNYRVYPLLSATYRLGGDTVRVTYANPGSEPTTVEVAVPEATLKASVPVGAEGLEPYIAGRKLVLTREIDGDLENLEAGDAVVVRTIAELDGLPAMFLPPLSPELAIEGVSTYADEPAVEDGDLARRIEKVTLVFEAGGEFTVPSIELRWWDMGSREIATATVPEQSISVTGPPITRPQRAGDAVVDWRIFAVRSAATLVVLLLAWRLLHRIGRRAREVAAARRESEDFAFASLLKACKTGEANATSRALADWLERVDRHLDSREFARRYGDEDLSRELNSLSAHLYGDADQSVSFAELARGLKAARGRYQARPAAVSVSALPSLNP
jgi:hypothetical protein